MKFDIGKIPNKIKITCTGVIRDVCQKDKEILSTHEFYSIKVPDTLRVVAIFRCKMCSAELDIFNTNYITLIDVFYGKDSEYINFESCQAIMMKKACD